MVSPFLYLPGDPLSGAELSAACLDGHLVAVGEGYMPADAVETAAVRAGSLTPLLRAPLAVVHLSAAWVHGAIDEPPARHAVQRAVPHRIHHVVDRRVVYRDGALPPSDLRRIGGVLVTTRARTIADLARLADAHGHVVASAWARAAPDVAEEGRAWIRSRPGLPHSRAALALLTGEPADAVGIRTT